MATVKDGNIYNATLASSNPISASVLNSAVDIVARNKIAAVEKEIPTKMSELEQDVETGKIDSIKVNGVEQEIVDKTVDLTIRNQEEESDVIQAAIDVGMFSDVLSNNGTVYLDDSGRVVVI